MRIRWHILWLCVAAIAWLRLDVPRASAADEPQAAARQLMLRGKYAEAREAFAALAADHPVEAALGLARCQMAAGEYDEAAATLDAASREHPEVAELPAEAARLALERGNVASCASLVDKALAAEDENLLARWVAAERDRVTGRLDEAEAGYKWLVDYYNAHDVRSPESLRWIGLAAAHYARWKRLDEQFSFLVNELYPDALEADPEYWPAEYEAGLLWMEKYNEAEANRALRAALAINPNAAEVHAALAQLALQNFDLDAAGRSIERALEINPRLLAAHWGKADALLANFRAAEAIEVLEAARALDPDSDGTLGRLAAAYVVVDGWRDDGRSGRFAKLVDSVVARNPQAGEFFYALGEALDRTRRFPQAARYYREAVERMPRLVGPRADLGLMYMRLGDEVEAKRLLDESFDVDPFNVRVSNSLKVLEVLDTYAVLETEHFVIKFDRGQDEILARYASRYLEEEVYPELCAHFGFEPKEKSLFEIFNHARNTNGHGWFSARMVGLPYVGTVGACAGKMVALASPNDMPQKYHWARVLKHEFVHVLNLQQTDFNIPHWYTEALAVTSEGYPRPQIWNELLADRVPKGELFTLDDINLGFVRPKSDLDWQMAYCQAELYAQYMVSEYGDDALAKMLEAYADNLDTPAAIRREFGVEVEQFEAGYLEYLREIAKGLSPRNVETPRSFAELVRAHEARPDDAQLTGQLAAAYLDRKDYPEARRLAQSIEDEAAGRQLAGYVLARIDMLIGEDEPAAERLAACLDREAPDERVLALLASFKLKAGALDEVIALYELAAKQNPSDDKWLKALAAVHLRAGNREPLAKILTELTQREADNAVYPKKLAQMALEDGQFTSAIKWANQAIYVDVMDPDVHRMLAEGCVGEQEFSRAAEEYEVALKLKPNDPSYLLGLAKACLGAERRDAARKALESLLELDPDHAEARTLLETLKPEPVEPVVPAPKAEKPETPRP